jgi:hypothetical protein
LGLSSATSQGDTALAEGFYGAGEFGVALGEWVSPRLYGGLLMTFPVQQGCQLATGCDVSDKIAFVGGKVRFLAPIPYVAPFVELGLGLSAGSLRTLDVGVDKSLAGITYHIPFALGLAVGKEHNIEIALSYLFHPAVSSFAGGIAVGLRLPVD